MMDECTTKNIHKPFLVTQFEYVLFSERASPMIMQGNQTTYQTIETHTTTTRHGQNDLTIIVPRSTQDLSNFQDNGHDQPMCDLSVQFHICATHT